MYVPTNLPEFLNGMHSGHSNTCIQINAVQNSERSITNYVTHFPKW